MEDYQKSVVRGQTSANFDSMFIHSNCRGCQMLDNAAAGDDDETLQRQQLPSRLDVGLKSRFHHRHIRHPLPRKLFRVFQTEGRATIATLPIS
ncbi:hypothetical protein GHT06_008121 [Daphnia sinensis]|uniref:Uncharacterized protein n=1 Tax=Daphnia sinensis TaxID=1820382 RepID=A0AAD5L3M2_9CRUS|nr:hypothetical protein GHT06_008121 [Daphnia sinensis]